ncbi:hypothetical protein O6R08_10775 [Cutibacterium equinum]|uniref:Uncharacterized protein n=1 Tax=Cutibacterium equinum TaxID=3016342 RepID=A0ABY7QXZ2_9ACTN|nr:hypothetical protein [Cutibacterium equinum]WCC79912.1 hypothetical protein O6R08_10775 [Cutibacterium equinum]
MKELNPNHADAQRRQLIDLLNHVHPGEIETVITGPTSFTRTAEARDHGAPTANRVCAEESSQR